MEMELVLDPDDSVRLPRLKILQGARQRKTRPLPVRIVWHDLPDGKLAARDLILGESRAQWTVEQLYPGDIPWPPASRAFHWAPTESPILPDGSRPDQLVPIAAFEGRETRYRIETENGAVMVTVRRGVLRSVADECQASRIWIDGSRDGVLHTASAIAGDVQVSVPRASLAAEAVSVARNTLPCARHLGAPALPGQELVHESAFDAFCLVLGQLTDVVLYHAPSACMSEELPEPVHQMRVAVRRARSAVSVFRSAMPDAVRDLVAGHLKTLGRVLGPTRDWDVFATETAPDVAAALPDDARLRRLIRAADRRRRECHATLRAYLSSAEFRQLGIELAWVAGLGFRPEQGPPHPFARLSEPVRENLDDMHDGSEEGEYSAGLITHAVTTGQSVNTFVLPPRKVRTPPTLALEMRDPPELSIVDAGARRGEAFETTQQAAAQDIGAPTPVVNTAIKAPAKRDVGTASPCAKRGGLFDPVGMEDTGTTPAALPARPGPEPHANETDIREPAPQPGETHDLVLTLNDLASTVLRRRWKKMLRAGRSIADLDSAALHDLRLRTKRVRYALEMLSSLYPGKSTARAIRRLSRLQQSLGILNDGAVASSLLTELGGPGGRHGYATGLILGFVAARGAEIRPKIQQHWKKTRKQPPPWA